VLAASLKVVFRELTLAQRGRMAALRTEAPERRTLLDP
jgi:hypothetical protein